MEYFCNFIWEQGQRKKNEDSLCICQYMENNTCYSLLVICDGIGGLTQGEDASSYTVNCMRELLDSLVKTHKTLSDRKIRNLFCRKIYQCHRILQEYGEGRQIQLGTTLSMMIIIGNAGYLFHIGDSAVFCGKRKLKRVTPIQHTDKGALLQAIGIGRTPKAVFKKFRIYRGMVLLIASDGFYRKVEKDICSKYWIKKITCDEEEIGKQLQHTKEKVQLLGEKDNISAICMKVW